MPYFSQCGRWASWRVLSAVSLTFCSAFFQESGGDGHPTLACDHPVGGVVECHPDDFRVGLPEQVVVLADRFVVLVLHVAHSGDELNLQNELAFAAVAVKPLDLVTIHVGTLVVVGSLLYLHLLMEIFSTNW